MVLFVHFYARSAGAAFLHKTAQAVPSRYHGVIVSSCVKKNILVSKVNGIWRRNGTVCVTSKI